MQFEIFLSSMVVMHWLLSADCAVWLWSSKLQATGTFSQPNSKA